MFDILEFFENEGGFLRDNSGRVWSASEVIAELPSKVWYDVDMDPIFLGAAPDGSARCELRVNASKRVDVAAVLGSIFPLVCRGDETFLLGEWTQSKEAL